jgi:ABC-type sulfate transport system permease component
MLDLVLSMDEIMIKSKVIRLLQLRVRHRQARGVFRVTLVLLLLRLELRMTLRRRMSYSCDGRFLLLNTKERFLQMALNTIGSQHRSVHQATLDLLTSLWIVQIIGVARDGLRASRLVSLIVQTPILLLSVVVGLSLTHFFNLKN